MNLQNHQEKINIRAVDALRVKPLTLEI